VTRRFPRRVGPAVANFRIVHRSQSTTITRSPTGRSAINAPQSGMTNWEMKSRKEFQSSFKGWLLPPYSFGEPAMRT
jgi:hypothetical protein